MKLTKTYFDAKEEIIQHCKTLSMNLDKLGYVKSNEETDNLVCPFDNWMGIKEEIGKGQGSELKTNIYGKVKFCAVHSSTALCVNNFAPFKQNKENFSFLNYTGFTEATFEKKLPTGISVPNLDFYLESNNIIIGIESKFIEILNKKLPNTNLDKYQNRKEMNYLPKTFSETIQYYIDCKNLLFLDVAQLIKHSIGLINQGRRMKLEPILVYIYWQPNNWQNFDVYHKHLEEINEFKERIERHISFIPISYLEFWERYGNDKTFGKHIGKVMGRYNIPFREL